MRQRIVIQQLATARRLWRPYVVLLVLVSACGGGPAPIAPMVLPALEGGQWSEWVEAYRPTVALLYDLEWTYVTQQGQSRGRAAIRFVPPDSVRFDYRGPFRRSGAAVIVGDSVLWVVPEDEVGALVEMTPLFWAMAGIPTPAPAGFDLQGLDEGTRRIWRFAGRADTLTFDLVVGTMARLRGQMRRAGKLIGTVEAKYDPGGTRPITAELRFPQSAALFSVTVAKITALTEIDEAIWKEP